MSNSKHFYINGEWVAPGVVNDFEVVNPSTEQVIDVISLGSAADADAAVAAARAAFDGWSQTSRDVRVALIERFLEIYMAVMTPWVR